MIHQNFSSSTLFQDILSRDPIPCSNYLPTFFQGSAFHPFQSFDLISQVEPATKLRFDYIPTHRATTGTLKTPAKSTSWG